MVKKANYLVFALFAVGLTGIAYGLELPSHVQLPNDLPAVSEREVPYKIEKIVYGHLKAEAFPVMTTTIDPSQYEVDENNELEGTALLIFNNGQWGCSGTLVAPNKILTAGHCVADASGNVDAVSGTAYFGHVHHNGDWNFQADYTYSMIEFIKHPDYNGKYLRGNDLAVVTIATDADANIPEIALDTNDSDTVGQVVDVYGFGVSGLGDTGKDPSYPFGTLRTGENTIDDLADTMMQELGYRGKRYIQGSVIQSDFDNGLTANDAFGKFFGISDLGEGDKEVGVCSGDSGGSIRNGNNEITGVNSYGIRLSYVGGDTSDVDDAVNCSFGEFIGYSNVAFNSQWIESVINGNTPQPTSGDTGGPPCSKKPERPDCDPTK